MKILKVLHKARDGQYHWEVLEDGIRIGCGRACSKQRLRQLGYSYECDFLDWQCEEPKEKHPWIFSGAIFLWVILKICDHTGKLWKQIKAGDPKRVILLELVCWINIITLIILFTRR